MIPKVTAAIFDFDMTLVDSSWAILDCTNALAQQFGLKAVTHTEVLAAIGLPIRSCWEMFWNDYKEEWLTFYRQSFRGREQEGIKPFPEAVATLTKLRDAGLKTAVVSNRTYARHIVEVVKLDSYMDTIVGLEEVTHPKPHPEALLLALKRLGVKPENAVYAGDTDIDMKTAAAAGLKSIGVATGYFNAPQLSAAGASYTIKGLGELPALLGAK